MKYRLDPLTVLRRGCPRCGQAIFAGPLAMRETCPDCGLDFDRGQPGYFTGAMYVSYALAIPLVALLTLLEHWMVPSWPLWRQVVLAWALCVPLIPWVWQYSRTIWIHFDQWVDPVDDQQEQAQSRETKLDGNN